MAIERATLCEGCIIQSARKMLSPNTYMDGRLVGNGRFGANAKNAGQLMDQLRAEFTFTVNNGVLYGLDLVKIASLLIKQSPKGGGKPSLIRLPAN